MLMNSGVLAHFFLKDAAIGAWGLLLDGTMTQAYEDTFAPTDR